MAYRVHIESFEGPFDLLLYLVNRQKVDIGSISINEITDQYLAEVQRMENVDLDVASDFLLVAATLLELKAAALIPHNNNVSPEEMEDLTPMQMQEALVNQLVEYKQFKNAAAALSARFEAEQKMFTRPFGPDRSVLHVVPDYLQGVTLDKLARLLVGCLERRDVFLLESEHIAARIIPLEQRLDEVQERIAQHGRTSFSNLLGADDTPQAIVVTFLAVLELFKRGIILVEQDELFGDIVMSYNKNEREA